ncbi:IclR family transcriptional regulator [Roseibium sp. TrichSKD4]|uniref:IclR family transcriptional regulator n=1 Tax=Roseibium sp. TrichSKD4 TaxID=744980 RepID=UPI00058B454E|nr:IclR family transcriptional regulator [Roseibium sp. TrichSKD4]
MSSNALLKALEALETFQNTSGSLSVMNIAELKGETLSSVQRSVYTLEALGYLEREENGKRFVPGRSCLRPVYGYLRNNRLLENATPYLIDLSERLASRADLSVLDGNDIVYLSRIPSRDELLNLAPLGRRWPAIHTASGRAILAAMTDEDRSKVLATTSFAKTTDHSLDTIEDVTIAINEARETGYAFQSEEVLIGAASVSAAVVGMDGRVYGAIILGGTCSCIPRCKSKTRFWNCGA